MPPPSLPAQPKTPGSRDLSPLLAARLVVMSVTLLCLASPCLGKLYKYTDETGVVHYTDSLNSVPAGARSIETVSSGPAMDSGKGERGRPAAAAEIDYGADEDQVASLQAILLLYKKTHTYSKADFFVCADMAIDVWNMARTKGFKVMIAAGQPTDGKATPQAFNHAWVLAEVRPSAWLAMETTAGRVVAGRENANYYRGHFFDSPREFKAYIDERQGAKQRLSEVRELEEQFTRLNDALQQAITAQQKLNEAFQHQCADKRLPPAKFNECREQQQALLNKISEGKELEGRVRQLADSHAAATAKLEASLSLLKQPVRTVTPR